jgi:hypothetical protein
MLPYQRSPGGGLGTDVVGDVGSDIQQGGLPGRGRVMGQEAAVMWKQWGLLKSGNMDHPRVEACVAEYNQKCMKMF